MPRLISQIVLVLNAVLILLRPLFFQGSALKLMILGLLVSLGVLVACAPGFNWREVPHLDQGFVAVFPDKPVTVTRELVLDGLTVPLTLNAANVSGLYFAVGSIPLRGALQGKEQQLELVLAQTLANNVSAGEAALTDSLWAGHQPARLLHTSGTLQNGEPAVLKVYFAVRGDVLYEMVLMGSEAAYTDVVDVQWFKGIRLTGPTSSPAPS